MSSQKLMYTTAFDMILSFNSDFRSSFEISSPETDNNFPAIPSLKEIGIAKLSSALMCSNTVLTQWIVSLGFGSSLGAINLIINLIKVCFEAYLKCYYKKRNFSISFLDFFPKMLMILFFWRDDGETGVERLAKHL